MADLSKQRCALTGRLYGVLCADIPAFDHIPAAEVVAVPSARREVSAFGHLGLLRTIVRGITEDEFRRHAAESGALLGHTDGDGVFCLNGKGGAPDIVDLYARIDTVPSVLPGAPTFSAGTATCLFLGTFAGGGQTPIVSHVPTPVWAKIKKSAGLWTIVGTLQTATTHAPISAASVTAFDTDIVQDDTLGTSHTDAGGVFRIDYPASAFRRGTFIDIELFEGPDLYFSVDDSSGQNLFREDRAAGRGAHRQNVDACACVHLEAKIGDGGTVGPIVSAWTGIGSALTLPDAFSMNSFDADGHALAAKYVLTGSPRMTGSAPIRTSAGRNVQYRFRISPAATTSNSPGTAPPAEASFTLTVGDGPGESLFGGGRLGQMIRYSPLRIVNIDAAPTDLAAGGWLDVNSAIDRTFSTTPGLTTADVPSFNWIDLDGLMTINTVNLTGAATTDAAIRFEIREVIDAANGVFAALPGNGMTLNHVKIDNTGLQISVGAQLAGHLCDPLSTTPVVSYRARHPFLAAVSVGVTSNDGAYSVSLLDSVHNLPLSGNTNDGLTEVGPGSVAVPTAGLKTCTYTASIGVTLRRHSGDGPESTYGSSTTFFYQHP